MVKCGNSLDIPIFGDLRITKDRIPCAKPPRRDEGLIKKSIGLNERRHYFLFIYQSPLSARLRDMGMRRSPRARGLGWRGDRGPLFSFLLLFRGVLCKGDPAAPYLVQSGKSWKDIT